MAVTAYGKGTGTGNNSGNRGGDKTLILRQPPPQNQRFSITNVFLFWAARHEEECYKNNVFKHFLVCKGLSNRRRGGNEHRISGDTPGSWFQNRRFRLRKSGGATVERLKRKNDNGKSDPSGNGGDSGSDNCCLGRDGDDG